VAGFPVDYDRGMNSYVFSKGYTLKRPAVSVEETLALAISTIYIEEELLMQ